MRTYKNQHSEEGINYSVDVGHRPLFLNNAVRWSKAQLRTEQRVTGRRYSENAV